MILNQVCLFVFGGRLRIFKTGLTVQKMSCRTFEVRTRFCITITVEGKMVGVNGVIQLNCQLMSNLGIVQLNCVRY